MSQLIDHVFCDRYRIQSLLGRKTGRRTFLARDLHTNSSVVIKLLLFGPDFTWDDLKLFEREADTLKALDHPVIPKYLDSFEVETDLGKGFALVQSYIEARSLQAWMDDGRNFSETEIRTIAKELLEILDYLHTRNPPVIHRDIKPSNILLEDRSGNSPGNVHLVDFGSVQTTAHTGTITIVGTYGYMPPEQFSGKTIPASDLYSLGATLIYLLTRTHPANLPSRNGRIQFEADSQINEQFQTWLKYLIQPDVSQRFNSAQLALNELKNDQLNFFAKPIHSKPSGSSIILTKTDSQLKIVIPPIPIPQKFREVNSTVWSLTFVFSPLLLFYVSLSAGLWVTPFVLYLVSSILVKNIYKLFTRTQVLIDENNINLTFDCLGVKREYSALTQDIIRLERLHWKYAIQDSINRQDIGLYLWFGSQRHRLGEFGSTTVELDWLAVELSEWLGLPIEKYREGIASDTVRPSFAEVPSTQSDPTNTRPHNTTLISQESPTELPSVSPPKDTFCHVTKNTETLRISTPLPKNNGFGCLICFASLFFFVIGLSANPLIALGLGAIPITFWEIFKKSERRRANVKILLEIDQKTIWLLEQSTSARKVCIKQTDRSKMTKIRLCYQHQKTGQTCHVALCSEHESRSTEEDTFLVGNRKFWLSRGEAEWLANELSTWMNLPVREVQVTVDNNSGY